MQASLSGSSREIRNDEEGIVVADKCTVLSGRDYILTTRHFGDDDAPLLYSTLPSITMGTEARLKVCQWCSHVPEERGCSDEDGRSACACIPCITVSTAHVYGIGIRGGRRSGSHVAL